MVLERLKQVALHVSGAIPPPHPFDPLSAAEIEKAVSLVRKEHGPLAYNAVTINEPRKAEMMAWLKDSEHTNRPHRIADVVAIKKGGMVYDGLVDLEEEKILKWESNDGVQPLVRGSMISEGGKTMLIGIDYNGRSSGRGACRARGSKSHRAMWYYWYTKRRYVQGLL